METNTKTNKSTSLKDIYQDTVSRNKITSVTMSRLLVPASSKKFIQERFSSEYKEPKIKECLDVITNDRSVHMVSAFLLGYTIRDQLSIDTRSWRRLPGENSPKGSFKLFWSWICLFHDIAYIYENNSADYRNYQQLEDLIAFLKLQNNLLDVSGNADLIRNYYAFRNRSCGHQTIDHGITGAVLLYNALCIMAKNKTIFSEIKKHNEFYVHISDTVALHNMWRSTDATLDDYMAYNLYELVPSEDNQHIIYYRDNSMLFLLALVDTIDPIKAFSSGDNPKAKVYDVLNNYHIRFVNSSRKKKLTIEYDSPYFEEYSEKLSNTESGMQSWLGVTVRKISSMHQLVITIDTETRVKT